MTKYTYAERVVTKVRRFVAYMPDVKDVANTMPSITLDNSFCLSSLYWDYYGYRLYVTNKSIEFKPEFGNKTTLLKYESFDAFLKMKL